ncbi:MAG: cupredoxin domain-containing protein [Nitrospira defluvii]|nr:cupredoxin domain-containing protein [Nitrospira defluvii]
MSAPMGRRRSLASTLAAVFLAVLWFHGGQVLVLASEPTFDIQAIRVDITIKARRFHPSPVSVPVGRPIVLVFHNEDVELHAFVPQQFLEHVPVHIDGNGAPQFGEKGFERVLIPSGGREEIHFVPTAVGTFEYRCDLPGHQMTGTIVVEEQAADHRPALGRSNRAQETP